MNARQAFLKPNFRFWEYVNEGFVKITIKEGQTLTRFQGCRHDEGYSRDWSIFELDDSELTASYESDCTDCDGRFSSSRKFKFNTRTGKYYPTVAWGSDGEVRDDKFNGMMRPKWQRFEDSQRDYEAEKAGY